MTKKDYKLIAEAIRKAKMSSSYKTCDAEVIISELMIAFNKDNPRFDPEKFRKAIYNTSL